MVKQDNFTMMKGHVNDGQQISMNCGDVWTIKAVIAGWDIINGNGDKVAPTANSAYLVENTIINA
jgi:hypothetical protein